jgi:hypothetical protein
MIRAGALYIVIIVCLLMAVLTSALVFSSYYHRLQVSMYETDLRLERNLQAASLLLLSGDSPVAPGQVMEADLFHAGEDSVRLQKYSWGVWQSAAASAFLNGRARHRSFLIGKKIRQGDTCTAVLYLSDQNNVLSLAGNTRISGAVYAPLGGIRPAIVSGKPFSGGKLTDGPVYKSSPQLPQPDARVTVHLAALTDSVQIKTHIKPFLVPKLFPHDTLLRSFNEQALACLSPHRIILQHQSLRGRILVFSAKEIVVERQALLEDVILSAPVIRIRKGFRGTLQAIATDSLIVEEDVKLEYPSSLVLIRMKDDKELVPVMLIGKRSVVEGSVLSFQKVRSLRMTYVLLDEASLLYGQLYVDGFLDIKGKVQGTVVTHKFVLRTTSSAYENHLLDAEMNEAERSRLFLYGMFNRGEKNGILKRPTYSNAVTITSLPDETY